MLKFKGTPTHPGFYITERQKGKMTICEACVVGYGSRTGEFDIYLTGLDWEFTPEEIKEWEFIGPINIKELQQSIN